jgi:hypothetical protein
VGQQNQSKEDDRASAMAEAMKTARLSHKPTAGWLIAVAAGLTMVAGNPAVAFAEAPSWHLTTEAAPTNLPPGGEGQIVVAASNLGDIAANGATTTLKITNTLPAGLRATSVVGSVKGGIEMKCPTGEPPASFTCTFGGVVNPYERVTLVIKLKVEEPAGTSMSLPDEVTVEGGGASKASSTQQLLVNGSPTSFGVQHFELSPSQEDGTPATQSGAQPFQLTTILVTNQTSTRHPVTLPKDLSFTLPPGLIGNPTAVAQCSEVDFAALVLETNLCPPSTVAGVATVTAFEPIVGIVNKTVPLFNLVPAQGEPARFGFEVIGKIPVVIDTSVRSGRDYSVVATVRNATQVAGLLSSQVTLWGDPGDSRHNNARGWECVAGGAFDNQVQKTCPAISKEPVVPFLRSPTSCAVKASAEPVVSRVEADSWASPGSFVSSEYSWTGVSGEALGFLGCEALPFSPSLAAFPEEHRAATPSGLTVDVKVPQQGLLEPEKLAEADVRDSTVTLPAGVELSPSAANGLQACSEAQVGYEGPGQGGMLDFSTAGVSCPDASKVGVVHIKTPLLSHELEGYAYLATPAPNGEAGQNPFSSLIALYIVAEDPVSGVLVKLAGEGHVDEGTVRISTTFSNTPQVPFEDLKLELLGGPRASVSTPPLCGAYATEGLFTPWSGTGAVGVSSQAGEFQVTSGPGGSPCPGPQPFRPGFMAESLNPAAGAFTTFALELSRPDGDQDLRDLSMHLPGGMAAMLSSVVLCSEAQTAAAACPAGSEVGQSTAVSGLGSEPFTVRGGRVYITGPYGGAPFGLEIVTPAVAGPFDLGNVVVRSKIYVNPSDASITIVSDPLPTQLKGIPLQLGHVLVSVDRPGFEFNPTNCSPLRIEGTLTGSGGAQVPVSTPFQASGCQQLPFSPVLTVSTQGATSKLNGASLTVRVTSTRGQANIAKTVLTLPSQLPSRLTTLQKACLAAVFEVNPASCPEGSVIGTATVHTPVLSSPLTGPAYLVSHGSAAFPDVEFVLQGEGITLILDGQTDIKGGVTTSSFNAVPDAPVSSFETTLPEGPHSALGATSSLCGKTLTAPTTITGQNGALISQKTHVSITGCKAVKSYKATRAQLLAKALAVCRKKYKHHHTKRISCERQAKKRYGAKKAAHKTSKQHDHKGRP